MSQSQVASIAFGAAGHIGVNTPIAGGRSNASVSRDYLSGLSAQEQKLLGSMTSEQLAAFRQFGERASRDTSFARLIVGDSREARDLSSRLSDSTTRTTRAEANLSERTATAERLSTAHERGESISIDIAQDPHNLQMLMRYADQYGGTSASAHALLASELARQSLRPSAIASDGTALPTTFDEVRLQGTRNQRVVAAQSDVSAARASNDKTVRSFEAQPRAVTRPDAPDSGTKLKVQTTGREIREKTATRLQSFDERSEVVREPDGSVSSKRSLLLSATKQMANDAESTLDNAQDTVKNLLIKR